MEIEEPEVDDGMSTFLFPCWRMPRETKLKITAAGLLISIFMERYCFITTVYKTKFYGYVLIFIVILLNAIFNYVNMKVREEKTQRILIEQFNLKRTPQINICVIGLIGLLDMMYAFFLFWPSNVIPMWLIISIF
mmetsp:Transcript_44947/g.43525  ORF Transcript_44947/g.43525 Transcript_44947/m.43525 type:complete len:135 (+) Transcript_44947:104-508(+)